MRNIINISLPSSLEKALEGLVKKGKYATKSELMRELLREKLEEEDILMQIRRSEVEFMAGKGKMLRSLKDLR